MSRMAYVFAVAAVTAITVCLPTTVAAQGQIPARVRVLTQSVPIMRWLGPQRDVILVVEQGTTLDVLDFDRDADSYWVILPPDLHGTRKVGWIRASSVEPYVASSPSDAAPPSSDGPPLAFPSEPTRDGTQAQAAVAPSTSAPAATEEKVTVSVRRDAAGAGAADGAGARKSYAFEDVHFERDRFAIRAEDIERLRLAATALKADPALVVTIEGHTCSLGAGPYNVALGNRRANAVREHLVSAGVPASRLVTVSQGETHAEHDNSREATRRLNRRVALVPAVQR